MTSLLWVEITHNNYSDYGEAKFIRHFHNSNGNMTHSTRQTYELSAKNYWRLCDAESLIELNTDGFGVTLYPKSAQQ